MIRKEKLKLQSEVKKAEKISTPSTLRVRRRDKRSWYAVLAVFAAVFLFTFLSHQTDKMSEEVEAASLANFDPGYIISDYQMGNYNSMSEAEIQAFLTSKNSCGNTDYNYYLQLSASNPGATWHFENGHFICLSEERFGDGEVIGSGETAAHIIWQAAQDYKINPQVLIVLLQKETSLIMDPIPNNYDYRKATGYGCPDTAPCSSEYYGFKNQVRKAASLFHTVLSGGWTNYPLGENYVQYNPSAACGGSVVNIRSLATSALYRYTPYQPNESVLAAGYGYGDSCGAYGNRNFYLYFEDWFGGVKKELASDITLEDGVYTIRSSLVAGYNVAINAGGIVNSSSMSYWIIERQEGGYYTIRNNDQQYLTAVENTDGSTYGVNMQVAALGVENQRWVINDGGNGAVVIYSYKYPNMVLDVDGASVSDGASIKLYERWGGDNKAQKWKIIGKELPDLSGDYYIMSALYPDKAIDVKNGDFSDGSNIQIYTQWEGNKAQEWSFKKDKDEDYYTIINSYSGKALDVSGGVLEDHSNIQIYGQNNTCAQKWKIKQNLDNSYSVRNYCNSQLVIDLQDYQTNIQIYSKGDENNFAQKWFLKKIEKQKAASGLVELEDGIYSIHPLLDTEKALDVENNSLSDMANVQIYSFWIGNTAQEWEIRRNNNDGYYLIRNAFSGKALDISGGVLQNNTNVWIYETNESCAQRWNIIQSKEEDVFVIKNACQEELVLDVQDYDRNIQVYEGWGDNNVAQKWKINKLR